MGKPGTPTKGQSVTPYNWQSGMHRVKFEGGKLKEIRIFPVDVGYGKPRWQQGRPMLAEGEVAQEILERYQRLSKPFGTQRRHRRERRHRANVADPRSWGSGPVAAPAASHRHCGLIPTSFTSFAHLARSERMNSANFGAVIGVGCML